jgi:hypothetical protein
LCSKQDLFNQLEPLCEYYSGLNEHFGNALRLVVNGMKMFRAQLDENSPVLGLGLPVQPARTIFDCITKMEQFFSKVAGLDQLEGAYAEEVKAIKLLTFTEKALMSSITIELNEIY